MTYLHSMFLHVFAMYDFLNVSCTALFQVLKNHPLVVWHHCGPGSVNETPHNMQWIIAFDLPTATITHQTMTQMCLHKCSYWLNLQQLEILESKSIQCWQFSERSLLIIMCPLYFLHGSCIRLYDTNNIPVLLYMDIYGIVFGCFFGYCGVWWAPWFGWFRAIQMITQRHEGKFWIHVKSSSMMFLLLSPPVLIQSLHHGIFHSRRHHNASSLPAMRLQTYP